MSFPEHSALSLEKYIQEVRSELYSEIKELNEKFSCLELHSRNLEACLRGEHSYSEIVKYREPHSEEARISLRYCEHCKGAQLVKLQEKGEKERKPLDLKKIKHCLHGKHSYTVIQYEMHRYDYYGYGDAVPSEVIISIAYCDACQKEKITYFREK